MRKGICTIVGVGPGVGMAVARRFAREGYHVALVGRTAASLESYRKTLAGEGFAADSFVADAAKPDDLARVLEQIRTRIGPIDVLVYNAYQGARGRLVDLGADAIRADLAVNVVGAIVASQTVAQSMRNRRAGTILPTGGGLAFKPLPELGSLALGKAALRSIAFSLHEEMKPHNVHVAMLTIAGFVSPDSHLSPHAIAEHFWELHQQPVNHREAERILR